jgi:CheY-like chemotaxis protein
MFLCSFRRARQVVKLEKEGWQRSTRERCRIGMSAYAEASQREKAIATGCDEFDAKPIKFESLVATVWRVLAKPK